MKLLWLGVQNLTLDALEKELRKTAKRARHVTIKDLTADKPQELSGLYFFFKANKLMYVGRSASVALVERVPAHFDIKKGAYRAHVLKKLAGSREPTEFVERVLGMRIALLVVKLSKSHLTKEEWNEEGKEFMRWLGKLEKVLIDVLRADMNSKAEPPYSRNTRVRDIALPECSLVARR